MPIRRCYGNRVLPFTPIMLYIVSYDVSTTSAAGKRRLRRVAKLCENYGVRVQNSVFECVIPYEGLLVLKTALEQVIDTEQDSLRIYPLGKNGREKIIHIGQEKAFDVEAPIII